MKFRQVVLFVVISTLCYGFVLVMLQRSGIMMAQDRPVAMENLGAIVLGIVLRTQLVYLREALGKIAETGSWLSWPRYEPKYLSAFVIALVGYGVSLLTVSGAWAHLLSLTFIDVVGLSYAGGALALDVAQALSPLARRI